MAGKAKTAPRADLLEREPSDMHTSLAEFIGEQTGYEADARTVQLVTALRKPFQKSEEHQSRIEERKTAREQSDAEKEKRRLEREAKAKDKPAKAAAKKTTAKKTTAKKGAAAAATDEPF